MGQRLSPEAASQEALRLLNLAMAILDDAGFVAPQCYISRAVDMMQASEAETLNEAKASGLDANWQPTWGQITDLPAR